MLNIDYSRLKPSMCGEIVCVATTSRGTSFLKPFRSFDWSREVSCSLQLWQSEVETRRSMCRSRTSKQLPCPSTAFIGVYTSFWEEDGAWLKSQGCLGEMQVETICHKFVTMNWSLSFPAPKGLVVGTTLLASEQSMLQKQDWVDIAWDELFAVNSGSCKQQANGAAVSLHRKG